MTHLGDIAARRTVHHGPDAATLPALLAAQAARRGTGTALLHKRHGLWRGWTWFELATETAALAAAIAGHGIRRGDVVVIAGPGRPRLLTATLACQWAGVVPVLVPQAGAGVKLEQVMADHAVRLAFVAGEHEVHTINTIPGGLAEPFTVVCDDLRGLRSQGSPRLRSWDGFSEGAFAPLEAPLARASDVAVLVYAGDVPEPVALTHAALTKRAEEAARRFALGPDDRALMALPLAWADAFLLGPAQALHAGFPLAFPENDGTMLRDLREVGPTLLFGPPTLFRRLRQEAFLATGGGWAWRGLLADGVRRAFLAAPMRDRLGVSRLRAAVSFGGIVPSPVMTFFARLGIDVQPLEALATTELERTEAALRGSVFIPEAAVLRTNAGALAALVSIDGDAVAHWAEAAGKLVRSSEDLATLEDVRALVGREIAAAVRDGDTGPVGTFLITQRGLSAAAGELTAQGELDRAAIERLHAQTLATLRAGEGFPLGTINPPPPRLRETIALRDAVLDGVGI